MQLVVFILLFSNACGSKPRSMHLRLPDTEDFAPTPAPRGSLWDRFKDAFKTDHFGRFVSPSPSSTKMPKKVESSPSPPPAPKANRHPKEAPLSKLEDDIEPPAPVTAAPTTDPFEAAAGHPNSRCPNADTEP